MFVHCLLGKCSFNYSHTNRHGASKRNFPETKPSRKLHFESQIIASDDRNKETGDLGHRIALKTGTCFQFPPQIERFLMQPFRTVIKHKEVAKKPLQIPDFVACFAGFFIARKQKQNAHQRRTAEKILFLPRRRSTFEAFGTKTNGIAHFSGVFIQLA
jgi:hypothetical protein